MSILNTTKAGLGLAEDDTAFDVELTMFVNSVLSRLSQLGVGPREGFFITGPNETWETFLGDNHVLLNNAKSYMVTRVKMMFDPPEIGFVLTAMKEAIEKDEMLLNITVEDYEAATEDLPVTEDPLVLLEPVQEPI